MFEVDDDWEGATEESKKLISNLFSKENEQKNSSKSCEKNCNVINKKKRKRGKKRKKIDNDSVISSVKLHDELQIFSPEMKKQKTNATLNLLNYKENKTASNIPSSNAVSVNSLQKRLLSSLESSRFRYLNEQVGYYKLMIILECYTIYWG